jgi:hypothetical protein
MQMSVSKKTAKAVLSPKEKKAIYDREWRQRNQDKVRGYADAFRDRQAAAKEAEEKAKAARAKAAKAKAKAKPKAKVAV